ncbi:hypothetical protein [Streptomyces sp. NBC_01092]|uniref:hypothetical protein n=1 Tax=Streptomyces sp. NBC_01092 TaxID=2903748 RepID=UPI0038687935|nr:hypothetical protein OG254_38895 [Streptomyces sp. NBC_01092]
MMSSDVTEAALDSLARRLDELADHFPTGPEAVDLVTLTDDINLLAHHLQQATERAQERFTTPVTVHMPERLALVRLSEATSGIANALHILSDALTYAATGFQHEATANLAHSPLRNDPKAMRVITAEKYAAPAPSCAAPPPACARHRPGRPRHEPPPRAPRWRLPRSPGSGPATEAH